MMYFVKKTMMVQATFDGPYGGLFPVDFPEE